MVVIKLGIERLLSDKNLRAPLIGKRVALLGHPASVSADLKHSLNSLVDLGDLNISAAFGPQHGMRGEKQDNMIESEHYHDPETGVLVYSLYSEVRRPTEAMMQSFDILLIDLQDVGTRVYTYLTTLLYVLEECARYKKAVWVLDRPNPAGRPAEGFLMQPEWRSFVGASRLPMRHGLTMAELALWLKHENNLDVELKIIEMENYAINEGPGFGWPQGDFPWVNPSPNMPTLCTARVYPGTVLLEGVNLSEGRGTTRPLQIFGAPKLDPQKILKKMEELCADWMKGCLLRPCYFEPTFHKFKGELCAGLQIHVDSPAYQHEVFQPYRLMLLFFKAVKQVHPDLFAWRQPPYEYEHERLPIDLLNGNTLGREWVDNPKMSSQDLDLVLKKEELEWIETRRPFLLYK